MQWIAGNDFFECLDSMIRGTVTDLKLCQAPTPQGRSADRARNFPMPTCDRRRPFRTVDSFRVGNVIWCEMRMMALRHRGIGMTELAGYPAACMERIEAWVCLSTWNPTAGTILALADVTHRAELFGAFPSAAIVTVEQDIAGEGQRSKAR